MESAKRALYGDLTVVAMNTMLEELKSLKVRKTEVTIDEYLAYITSELGKKANELARLPDYEKCTVQECEGDYIISIVISQKTKKLADTIKDALTNLTDPSANLLQSLVGRTKDNLADNPFHVIYKICCTYLDVFRTSFSSQLLQLPHLAALYFNDARYLSLLCRIKCAIGVVQCGELEVRGAVGLQANLGKLKGDIHEMLPSQTWQVRYGQLDDATLWSVIKSFEQVHLRLCQLHKVLSPILDESLFVTTMNNLLEIVLTWLWEGLLSVKSISKETLSLLPDIVQSSSKLFNDALGAERAAKWPSKQCSQLATLLRISQQNLIQVSNAFRREEFIDTLSYTEFRSVVNVLFPDTAMKAAFLAEIEAEIN